MFISVFLSLHLSYGWACRRGTWQRVVLTWRVERSWQIYLTRRSSVRSALATRCTASNCVSPSRRWCHLPAHLPRLAPALYEHTHTDRQTCTHAHKHRHTHTHSHTCMHTLTYCTYTYCKSHIYISQREIAKSILLIRFTIYCRLIWFHVCLKSSKERTRS